MSAGLSGLQAIDIIKAIGICDTGGHVQSCGYDENDACFCVALPTLLRDAIDPIIQAAVNDALDAQWAGGSK